MKKEMNELLKKQPILLFDGECGFCNKAILFFLKHENKKALSKPFRKMHFASLQSEVGIQLKEYFELDEKIESLILIKDYSAFIKSCAALRLTMYMAGLWPLLIVFVVIPPFLRNIVYNYIAKRRMKIFGKIENCALLKKEDQSRFLDV